MTLALRELDLNHLTMRERYVTEFVVHAVNPLSNE